MKKLTSLLLTLCLVLGLTGCGSKERAVEEAEQEKLVKKTGFSITLPSNVEDTSANETAEAMPFILTVDDIVITAWEEYKTTYGYEMTAEEYANVLIDTNKFDSTVEIKEGIPTFTFQQDAEKMTYLCITQVTDSSYWYINAACNSKDFQKQQDTMWKYLRSVKTSSNKSALMTSSFQTITWEDLTMQLPADAQDVTQQWNTGATFVYSISDENAVQAVREEKDAIDEYVESLEYYCSNLIEMNELDSEVKTRNGIPYFSFTTNDGALTHLVTVYEGTDAFWYLQSYTETNLFSTLEDSMWAYLETVQVA